MQSNPIQQRIELICEKWEEAKKFRKARIVLIRCQADEEDMVDTFYTYMIGADTSILDIAFHFDSSCTDLKLYSIQLLKELEEIIEIWNNSQKDARIDYVPIHWKPDYSLQRDKNPASLFVQNFNVLAKEMNLGDDLFAVAILKGAIENKGLLRWLEHAMEAPISANVKFLIHDTVAKPSFEPLVAAAAFMVATIPIKLDMPKAMEQIAAMGDPKDPATSYRTVFMKMMNAMGAGNEQESEKHGLECVEIANRNISKDPYWIMQVVVVYIALGNDKVRYKKKKETLGYADKAVEAATASKTYFEDNVSSVLMAQALMFRGTIYFVQDNFINAYSDLSIAFEIYRKQGNKPLAIEASRMAGKSALKTGQKNKGIKILAEGALLGRNFDQAMARGSTYAALLEILLQTNHNGFISMAELDEIAQKIYGQGWMKIISNWKKIPDTVALKQQELEASENN